MTTVYREVLHQDNINIEASACLATNFFYNDQPEVALQYYRCVHVLVIAGSASGDGCDAIANVQLHLRNTSLAQ